MLQELGLNISEKEYRSLNYPSYSLLSSISKYGPDALYGEKVDISDLDGIVIGALVDSIITDGKDPDNLVIIDKKPTGKPLDILKALSKRPDLKDPYLLSKQNADLILEELDIFEYYKSSNYQTRLQKLKNYNKYAKALSNPNAFIVSDYQYNEAVTISERIKLRYGHLFNEDTLTQLKITGTVNGVELKCMLDFIVVDHKNKILYPYDLKTGINPHYRFFEEGFLGFNYYLQASLYRHILEQNVLYSGYEVDNFKFLYCGRSDKLPIIYEVTDKFHQAGFDGFKYKGLEFRGLNELIEEFEYYKEYPNAFYRKGFTDDIVNFDDSFL